MPQMFIKKELYDKIVRRGYDVNRFVEEAVREKIEKIEEESRLKSNQKEEKDA